MPVTSPSVVGVAMICLVDVCHPHHTHTLNKQLLARLTDGMVDSTGTLLVVPSTMGSGGAGAGASAGAGGAGAGGVASPVPVPVDVVFLDIMMLRTNGEDVCKQLRAAGIATPIVAATANGMKADVQRYTSAGFTQVMLKPFSSATVRAVLTSVVNRVKS